MAAQVKGGSRVLGGSVFVLMALYLGDVFIYSVVVAAAAVCGPLLLLLLFLPCSFTSCSIFFEIPVQTKG